MSPGPKPPPLQGSASLRTGLTALSQTMTGVDNQLALCASTQHVCMGMLRHLFQKPHARWMLKGHTRTFSTSTGTTEHTLRSEGRCPCSAEGLRTLQTWSGPSTELRLLRCCLGTPIPSMGLFMQVSYWAMRLPSLIRNRKGGTTKTLPPTPDTLWSTQVEVQPLTPKLHLLHLRLV